MKQWIRASLGLAVLWPALAVVAQNTNSGDIRGVVTDSSGAVIPGATVKVDDVDKGISHTYTTDGAGLYDTGPIVPDHYLITVTAPGFQTYVRGPVTLQVATVTVDAVMTVGGAQQQVVVKTELPLLQTETGEQSQTLESKQLLQLPQVGADWQNFITLLPGATSHLYNGRPGAQTSINGNLPFNSVLADGATTTLPMSQNSDVMVLETVSEVKVSDSAFSAQYGIGGATFNQISKGGTNRFHGAAYEYFQNDALNAADYAFGQGAVPFQRYNNFGFSVGGPILKDKVFFYFNYDKIINPGSSSSGFKNVPTAAMRNGDFTGFQTIYDPTTQTVDSAGVFHRKSFLQEYGSNAIPASMIDPVAAAITKFYPTPNVAGASGFSNNFFFNVPNSQPFTKYFGRLDWQINPNNHFIASETSSDNPAQYHNEGICPLNCQSGDVSRDNAQVSWVWTISPQTVNEARMGFTDQLNFFVPYSLNQGFPAKLGMKFAKADLFPDINVAGNGGDMYELQPNTNAVYKEFVFDPSDVVTLIRGRHVLHFGGEFLIERADSTAWGNQVAGHFNFTGAYTAAAAGDTSTGMAFADFLLGYANEWDAKQAPEWGGRLKSPQIFVQDDFKIRPNLTVNLGLRWQGMTGWHEVKGNILSFDPTVTNPANGSLGAIWYANTKANGRDSLQAPTWNTFLPRVGFSYGHGPKTVVRGGIGLYGYTWSDDTYGPGIGSALQLNGQLSDTTTGTAPVTILGSDGNGVYQGSLSANSAFIRPIGPAALNGQGVPYQEYHTPVARILEWNFEVQQQISTDMLAKVAYVASHGYNLLFPADINAVPEAKLSPNDQNLRPYPLFQGINDGNGAGGTNNGVSNYNSLQTSFEKRYSYGLQFLANYTWSHMLTSIDSSGWGSGSGDDYYQRPYDPGANYGASNFDQRNSFKTAVIYDLPFGKGRQFLNNNWLADETIGGWQIAPSVIWSSGVPYSIIVNHDNSSNSSFDLKGNGALYPDQIGNPNPSHRSIQEWFDPAAFQSPNPGTYGNTRRNNLYGPSYLLVNAAIGKTFHIPWEGIGVEIRASANNVINHPSFDAPDSTLPDPNVGVINSVTVHGRSMQLYGRISF
jgi:hypothetical protein